MKNKKRTIIMLILAIMILVMMSGCSIFPSTTERHLFFDSICWEDDEHILMYSMVRKWINTSAISWGSETGRWDWSKGEIWRINVFTGEKELLLRREGDKYTGLSTVVKIDILGERKLISLDGNAYIMEGESTDWKEIEGIYEAEWINDNEIIGIDGENWNIVKYNIETNECTNGINSNANNEYPIYFVKNKSNEMIMISNYYKIEINTGNFIYTINDKDTFILNDSVFIFDNFFKCYKSKNNTFMVMTRSYLNGNPITHLIEFDSSLSVCDFVYNNNNDICPRKDMQIFANMIYIDIYKNSDKIVFTDRLGNILSTANFPLDQLDE